MEENKVATREKLAKLIGEFFVPKIAEYERAGVTVRIFPKEELADAILQSPDLRVTPVEPRFRVEVGTDRVWVFDGQYSLAGFARSAHNWARDYCDWLNSKEPK